MYRFLSLFLALVCVYFFWSAGSWLFASFVGRVEAGPAQVVHIERALSNQEVGDLLENTYHVIDSSRGYRFYTFLAGANGAKSGEYEFHRGLRYKDIARMLERGPQRVEREVQVIEGWDIRDEAAYLASEKPEWSPVFLRLSGQSANQASFDPKWRAEFPFLASLSADRSLDGYLFPDTYRVWEDEMPEGLIRKQLQTFDQKVFQRFKGASLPAPLKSFDEAVILASIVEQEVRSDKDRKLVAGLFLRRLREGMALQSDATLTYITGSTRGRATTSELTLDSRFNSYKYKGLPPSPIAHPALSALEAVFEPTPSTYRYFLTDEKGEVLYASTFEEHQRNRQRAGY